MDFYYNKFSSFLLQKYGQKVWKVSLDAGLACPNCQVDGKEGCIFCRNDSFSFMGSKQQKSISQQMYEGIERAKQKFNITKYLAYFQSSTNTFAPIPHLEKLFLEAINFKDVVAISIATRPDCLSTSVIELLQKLTKKVDVWIELGLQSSHNKTLKTINRGHTFEDYTNAVEKLKKIDVRICTHIIIGLPGESRNDIIKTAKRIAQSETHEVKIHPLLILRQTQLESYYNTGKVFPLTLEKYTALAVDFLELLPPTMVIQRLTAEAPKKILIEPQWSLNKLFVLNAIQAEFQRRKSHQGIKFKHIDLKR
ncbi:TIGR01212 family radical SAM protein [candidate division KSB1 bacterium]|nr:TIGR01212 family radical SAM protein [candidate division KSB1 bacterium]RQW06155.1 MAG: TIGR01212 family radical SAM protein [candidate division KSB1 bacterium]